MIPFHDQNSWNIRQYLPIFMIQSSSLSDEKSHTYFDSSHFEGNSSFDEIHYHRKIGSYTPHFEGLPEDYWPMGKKDVALWVTLLALLIAFFVGFSTGLVEWCISASTETFAAVWSVLFIIFWLFFALMAFGKSKGRYQNNERNVRIKIREQKVSIMERFDLAFGKVRKKSLLAEMKEH